MTVEQPTEQTYRLASLENFIVRMAKSYTWCGQSLSSTVVTGIVLSLIVYSLLVRQTITADPLLIEVEHLGDPGRALERIRQEHFISLSELDELSNDPDLDRFDQIAYQYAPLFLDEGYDLRSARRDDVPIGVYYAYSVSLYGNTELVHLEYWMYFSDENVGMRTPDRMARWGHPLDRELIFRMNLLNGQVYGAEYQAPIHRLTPFIYPDVGRPVFRIASGNHNFQLVRMEELETSVTPVRLVAPLPQYEMTSQPLTDPDIMALAAQEALIQYDVNMSHYVFVGIRDPAYVLRDPFPFRIDVGVLVNGRWRFLRETIGHGLQVWGYRLVAIDVGVPVKPGDIESVILVTGGRQAEDRPNVYISRVFVYSEVRVTI